MTVDEEHRVAVGRPEWGGVSPDTVDIAVGPGGQVVVVSDMHLGAVSDEGSETITSLIARRLEEWSGPGVLVLAGDIFELSDEPNNSPQRALTAHPRFADALSRFVADADHQLVVLSGEHDARMSANDRDRRELTMVGAVVGRRCDLHIGTGGRTEVVRVEHRSPMPAALNGAAAQHAVTVTDRDRSRRFYATLSRVWWIPVLVPVVIVLGIVVVAANVAADGHAVHHLNALNWLYFACSTISVQIMLTGVMAVVVARRIGGSAVADVDVNATDRAGATLLAAIGFDGYIGCGSHRCELVDLGSYWYANTGCARRHVTRRKARFGLPELYATSSELSWVEIEAGATLHVWVIASRRDDRPVSRIERLAATARLDIPPMPTRLVTLAEGVVWPTPIDPFRWTIRTRRRGAVGLFALGVVDLLSALTPPLRERLYLARRIIPVGGEDFAAGVVAAAGIGLIILATGLRRGRRLAWLLSVTLLVLSAIGHLVKGFDVEEAILAGLLAIWLGVHRQAFSAPAGGGRLRRFAAAAAIALLLVELAAAGWISAGGHRNVGESLSAAFENTIGFGTTELPGRARLLATALPMLAAAGVLIVGWYAVRARRAPVDDAATITRTWEIVRRHGRGTLDYFALRDDKRHFICEDTVVAYTVFNATAVVSPDPVGPADQRSQAWMAFRTFAVTNGWRVAALGASQTWLPIYRSSGMWAMYIGDESVVDVQQFTLDGGRHKSLRKAVNRVAKAGYSVEFHDPAHIDPLLATELRELATQSRQGSVERGFSMTLSRLFDPRDQGLLLAVARDPAGRPAAFCQFVPAAGIDGYSLDLMRRGDAAHEDSSVGTHADSQRNEDARPVGHPNGLTEFVVVRTIEHLRSEGRHGLGLHFATMRALLAGQIGSRLWHRALAEVMHRMSDDMQIESLWRFNAKFDPTWLPRYVAIDTPESTLFAGLAIASVESLWELPVIGRFMRPSEQPSPPLRTATEPGC